jgi:uncharacterized membrane protein YgcG
MTSTDIPLERRKARLRRTLLVRKRIAIGAVTLFMLVWAALFVQMATGHDPALDRQRSSTTTTSTASGEASTASSSSSSQTGSSSAGSSESTSSREGGESSGGSALTTGQS